MPDRLSLLSGGCSDAQVSFIVCSLESLAYSIRMRCGKPPLYIKESPGEKSERWQISGPPMSRSERDADALIK